MNERALFGWQGFSFEHPVDWAPVVLSGTRNDGYVRLASGQSAGCQVRWKTAKSEGDLPSRLHEYLGKLERGFRKEKQPFRKESFLNNGHLEYKWMCTTQARGALFFVPECSRIFFVEALGGRKDSLLPAFRLIANSFASGSPDGDVWAILGLSLRLPAGLSVDKKTLVAGRTHLTLASKGVRIEADRWGFAEQLIARHGMSAWAAAVLRAPAEQMAIEPQGLRLERRGRLGHRVCALVSHQPAANQLVILKVTAKNDEWTPKWEWLS